MEDVGAQIVCEYGYYLAVKSAAAGLETPSILLVVSGGNAPGYTASVRAIKFLWGKCLAQML
jgi:hypothetical protein